MANLEGIDTQYVKINQFFFQKSKRGALRKGQKMKIFSKMNSPLLI